jgi:putative inorganic carbon (hco3(-)) transporter
MLLSSPSIPIVATGGRADSRSQFAPCRSSGEAAVRMPASYWLLLAFLLLVYANTPFVLPAAEILRPAKLVAALVLLTLIGETMFGQRKLLFAWPEGGLLIAFLAAAAFSCLTALWPGYAADGVADLAKMALTYFFLVNCVNSERGLRGVMWIMVIGGLFPAAGTLRNYLEGNPYEGRASWVGIFANPNEVAYSLVILVPLLAYLATPRSWAVRLILLVVLILYVAAIYVTFSRGGLVGLAAVIALCAWRKRNLWFQGLALLLLVGGLAFASRFWTRGEDFSQLNSDVSFQQRLATSQAGFDMFMDHPMLGVGFGCSVIAWPLYAPAGLYTRGALVTHNTFVQVLSETGLLGFLPFVLLIGFSLYHARKLALQPATADSGAAVEVALWGLVVCGMSGGYVLTWFPYLLLGLAAAARRIPEQGL